jgi:hypothetical protein
MAFSVGFSCRKALARPIRVGNIFDLIGRKLVVAKLVVAGHFEDLRKVE